MKDTDQKLLRVLLIPGSTPESDSFVQWLFENAEVEKADGIESARDRIQGSEYDFIVGAPQSMFCKHTCSFGDQAATLLESIGHGAAIVKEDGSFAWDNIRMREFPEEVRNQISRWCIDLFSTFQTDAQNRRDLTRIQRSCVVTHEKQHLEATGTPVLDNQGTVNHIAVVLRDTTHAHRLQLKIDAIDRAGEELVQLDTDQMTKANPHERLVLLEQRIIRYTRDLMQFDNFAVRVLDRKTRRLDLALSAGMPIEAQNIELFAESEHNGISGYVATRGRSYICPDVRNDPRYIMGINDARSSLTVPLRLHGQVVGIFNVESNKPGAFNEDDRQFAEIFARHVAVALHILNLLDTERHSTTGRVVNDFMAEVKGPLENLMAELESLTQDYIGHDDVRIRLNCISDHATMMREAIRHLTQPRHGIKGEHTSQDADIDPVLSGKKILVVDDEEFILETVTDVLGGYGARVQALDDAPKAIDVLKEERFDLVLSDIKMPGGNGYEIYAAAKEMNVDCPVILMTGFGYDPNHSIIRARQEGLSAVLFKPFKLDQLLGELRNALK